MMVKLSPADRALWEQVTAEVRPLKTPRAAAPTNKTKAPATATVKVKTPALPKAKTTAPQRDLQKGKITDLDRRNGERLKRGKMEIDGKLDLHGLRQDAAHAALDRFIAKAARDGKRCLLIVTGKGLSKEEGGVLKRQVPRWLNEAPLRPHILAVTDAQPQHGGSGALYVLLRRQRE